MRKRLIAAVTAVAVLGLGVGVAFAENIYEVHIAGTSKGKGTLAKPLPVKLNFGYTVGDSEGLRPTVIKQYRIAPEGHVTYPKAFPSCTFEQADRAGSIDPKCKKAIVGSGLVRNNAGAGTDRTQKLVCNLKLTLINISTGDRADPPTLRQVKKEGGMAIRLDGDPPAATDVINGVGCTLPVHKALAAPFYDVKLNGRPSSELRFSVPQELTEPLPGVNNAVIEARSVVKKRVARARVRGKMRRVGYYSKVACRKTGVTRVVFVDEQGRKFTALKRVPGRC
jgi:hypothetical protein